MYWFLIFVLSPVMIPEVTARWNSPQISSWFLRGEFSCDRGSWKSEGEVISWSLELAFNYFFHTVDNAISWNILLKFSVDWRNCFSVLIFYQPAFVVDQITFLISTTKSILFSFLWFFPVFKEWMEAIKKFCGKPVNTNLGERDVKQLRSLEVIIVEAHKLSSNKVSHPYCMISLNEVKTCRTKTQEGHSPIWNEEFKFK